MEKQCPLCSKQIFSAVGKGCKMCGMPLDELNEIFCSDTCFVKYFEIHLLKHVKGGEINIKNGN